MINTYEIYNELRNAMDERSANIIMKIINEIVKMIYEEQKNKVTKVEFNELKEVVYQLAIEQKKTAKQVRQLIKAQKRTEKRVEELAIAQQQTEERLNELAKEVKELAIAQKNTEKQIKELTEKMTNLSHEVGKFTNLMGNALENEALVYLPFLLKEDHNIEVIGKLNRSYLKNINGRGIEINIFGKGKKDGQECTIIGEVKSRLTRKKIDDFIMSRIEPFKEQYKNIILILVTHNASIQETEEYAKSKGIIFYYSNIIKDASVQLLLKK